MRRTLAMGTRRFRAALRSSIARPLAEPPGDQAGICHQKPAGCLKPERQLLTPKPGGGSRSTIVLQGDDQ